MSLTGTTPSHPARFSSSVLEAMRPWLSAVDHVHDPFAGEGRRLGALCDELGVTFTGTDLEAWPERDERVRAGDSSDPSTYPAGRFAVATSPVYFGNRISSDYVNGPTSSTKLAGRHAYGISLGRALDPRNMARLCRSARRSDHDAVAVRIARLWSEVALVNVDAPIERQWTAILELAGFVVDAVIDVPTPRLGGGIAGAAKRATHEVLIVAERPT